MRAGHRARHLSRLFQQHLGASPVQIAKTFRLKRAKRLLDDADLRITEIAYRAGFKSLRRFNAAFVDLYKTPPSDVRRRGSRAFSHERKSVCAGA
jgi:AraC family transcriptional regulator of adaptative response / DNA-3-methyladenine glycosylase II